ncbi:hypothetical protein GVAV_003118 [Gurleya vavrai]
MVTESLNIKDVLQKLQDIKIQPNEFSITIFGKYNDQNAIIVVNTPSLAANDIFNTLKNSETEKCTLRNDVFSCFDINSEAIYNLRLIYPADDEKIKKYSMRKMKYISEDRKQYEERISKQLKNETTKNNWIRNIIDYCDEELLQAKIFNDDKSKSENKIFEGNDLKNESKNFIDTNKKIDFLDNRSTKK